MLRRDIDLRGADVDLLDARLAVETEFADGHRSMLLNRRGQALIPPGFGAKKRMLAVSEIDALDGGGLIGLFNSRNERAAQPGFLQALPGCNRVSEAVEMNMGVDQFALRSRLLNPAHAPLGRWSSRRSWQLDASLVAAFATLLQHLPGQKPAPDDLQAWAERLASAWSDELLGGEGVDLDEALGKPMELTTRRQEVAMSGIRFSLVCPHHLTLAIGEASVRYRPRHHLAGPSGIVRLIDAATRRRILQEEATELIADTLERALQPQSLEVILQAEQTCVSCRGVRRQGTDFTTTVQRGHQSV